MSEKRKIPSGDCLRGKCPKCGIDIEANIPFIEGIYSGYKSEDHGCGENHTRYVTCLLESEIEDFGFIKESI